MLNKEKCEYILECNWDKTPPVMRHMVEDLIKEHFEHVESVEKQKKLDELQKACEEMYTNETYFQHIIKAIAKCKDEEIREYAVHCLSYLKMQLDNPALKFEDLKPDMWVWDNGYKEWCYIYFIAGKYPHRKYIDNRESDGEFEENRFYRKQMEE